MLEPMGDIGNAFTRWSSLGRGKFLRLMFPQVCLLELQDPALCMTSIIRGRHIEIVLLPVSYLIVRFLADYPTIRTSRPKRNRPGLPLIFQGV